MTVEILSRIQFAVSITGHYIYPPLSIGLSLCIVYMEWMFLRTGDKHWETLTKFWVRLFALTFALGVATGIPLPFSFGTNWARYSRFVGDVFGSALAAEGIFAFLVEAGFLGILLFGWDRVSRKMHFLATTSICAASHFSAIWIVIANSWMQTPHGYEIIRQPDGTRIASVTNWWQMIFNHSSIDHIFHVIISCWMCGALLILSISAYYLLRRQYIPFAISSMKVATSVAVVASLLQLVSADQLGRVIAEHNPEKFAAFEGLFDTEPYTPQALVGWVDEKAEKTHAIKIPGLLSFLIYRDSSKPVPGLLEFPKESWPAVNIVFQLYHLMISAWVLIALAAVFGAYIWKKKQWLDHPYLLRYMVLSVIFPQIGGIAGWYSACMGRQPWIVYKELKTREAFSENITVSENMLTLFMFLALYLLFFVLFLVLLDQKIKHGPSVSEEHVPYRDQLHQKEE